MPTLVELLRGGHSALQGASNAAASNVTGLVDLLALGLRKGGLPIPDDPVGGSAWARQMGLTREPENKMMGLLGEGAGLAAPFVAVAKAPQIAAGANQAIANALAPATLNKQRGAIVWHGSPHKFDAFDASKIGTGEGAQAYGHGLYLAESPDVSKTYMRTQLGNAPELEQMALRAGVSKDAANTLAGWYHQTKDTNGLDKFLELMRTPAPSPYIQKFRDSVVAEEPALRKAWQSFADPGSIYKVDLPDNMIAKMLDWDKPLSQQAPEIQAALEKSTLQYGPLRKNMRITDITYNGPSAGETIYKDMARALVPEGERDIWRGSTPISGQGGRVAGHLRELGIPGIRYLDGGSRGTGAGTSNFVVFPGEEKNLRILERNGKLLELLRK